MREVTLCIENNIRQECGEKASELVHLLVKPMVRRSGSCTYDVYHQVHDITCQMFQLLNVLMKD